MTDTTRAQQLIRAVEQADSSARLLDAVQQLASARILTAVPNLIAALGYNNPGAAVAAVDGLIQIGEAAVLPLLEQIDDKNYGSRAWAIRALAGIGDPRALPSLLYAAQNDFALSVRRAAARGLGTLRWHQLPPAEVQPAQAQALEALLVVSQDSEWIVRYAAVVGLQALATAFAITQPNLVQPILDQFDQMVETDPDKAVRTRVRMAQQQLQEFSQPI
jgi:phycocyanobilin lyase subunit beta